MPSTSAKQAKLMRAVAHGWKKPGGGGPSQAVAQEFESADEASGKWTKNDPDVTKATVKRLRGK
jgi:hypothetical protein